MRVIRKRLKVAAKQRNAELRQDWINTAQQFIAEQLVCVDETGSDDRSGDGQYGWAEKGVRALVEMAC